MRLKYGSKRTVRAQGCSPSRDWRDEVKILNLMRRCLNWVATKRLPGVPCAVVIALAVGPPMQAQIADPTNPAVGKVAGNGGPYVLRQDVQEVLFYCTVLDRKGSLVTGLDPSAFRVS